MGEPVNRQHLKQAIRHAVALSLGTGFVPTQEELEPNRLTETLMSELELGIARIGDRPLDEDLQGYLYALLATKTIAGCDCNENREAALRLLYGAAAEVRKHRFPQPSCLIACESGDLEPWPATGSRAVHGQS